MCNVFLRSVFKHTHLLYSIFINVGLFGICWLVSVRSVPLFLVVSLYSGNVQLEIGCAPFVVSDDTMSEIALESRCVQCTHLLDSFQFNFSLYTFRISNHTVVSNFSLRYVSVYIYIYILFIHFAYHLFVLQIQRLMSINLK